MTTTLPGPKRSRQAMLLAVLACCACASSGSSSSLAMPGVGEHPQFGIVVTNLDGFSPYVAGGFGVCATGNAPISITEIAPSDPQHLELSSFVTLGEKDRGFGDARKSLEELGFDLAHRSVDAPCPSEATFLALELRRTSLEATATAESFTISYTDATGRSGKLHLPFHITICAPDDPSKDCQ